MEYEEVKSDTAAQKRVKAEHVKEIKKTEKKCYSAIVQRIQDRQLEIVKSQETALGAWEALSGRYEKSTTTSRVTLTNKLQRLFYRPSQETFEEYFLNFDRVVRELRQAGEKTDDEGAVIQFLLLMPTELDTIVYALKARGEEKLKMELVRQEIEEFEMARRNRKHKSNYPAPPIAFTGYNKKRLYGQGPVAGYSTCGNWKLWKIKLQGGGMFQTWWGVLSGFQPSRFKQHPWSSRRPWLLRWWG